MGVTYCKCVFVALDIQQAMRMRHIVICDLSGSRIFFPHNFIKDTIFGGGGGGGFFPQKICFFFFPKNWV